MFSEDGEEGHDGQTPRNVAADGRCTGADRGQGSGNATVVRKG